MGDNRGIMVTIGFGFNPRGEFEIQKTAAGLPPPPPSGKDWQVPNDGHNDAAVLALSAVGTAGVGMLLRGLRKEKVFTIKDVALDAAVGLEIGTCLVGTPQAESICYGVVGGLPMQVIDRLRDPKWDFRVGLITNGALSLARSELGGNYVPLAGYRSNTLGSDLKTTELLANASADVVQDAAFYALSNTTAALLQGYKLRALPGVALSGAAYGGVQSMLDNVVLGAPLKLTTEMKDKATAIDNASSGPNIGGMFKFTTFRSGGLLGPLMQGNTITLGRNVAIQQSDISTVTVAHEMVHRTQIAGGSAEGRNGTGLLSFYAQYLTWAPKGYENIPYEREAYHYSAGAPQAPYREGKQTGDFVAAPFALSLFALPAALMPPPVAK